MRDKRSQSSSPAKHGEKSSNKSHHLPDRETQSASTSLAATPEKKSHSNKSKSKLPKPSKATTFKELPVSSSSSSTVGGEKEAASSSSSPPPDGEERHEASAADASFRESLAREPDSSSRHLDRVASAADSPVRHLKYGASGESPVRQLERVASGEDVASGYVVDKEELNAETHQLTDFKELCMSVASLLHIGEYYNFYMVLWWWWW
jgi:hypothetical protein